MRTFATSPGVGTRTIALIAALALLTGCAESFIVNTYPPGAEVFIDDLPAGRSPVEHIVPRAGPLQPLRYRIEKTRAQTVEGVLEPRVTPGRVIGAVLTLGISTLFRGIRCYDDLDIQLHPVKIAEAGSASSTADRLQEVQNLFDRGIITEREYKRLRARVLDEGP